MSRWPAVPVCLCCAAGFIRLFFFFSESHTALKDITHTLTLPSPILLPSLLQGSCTPLMVATLHPPSAGIAPQYSLPLGLGAGVGQPTLLEHTATVLVKQRWHPWRKTCTRALPLPLTTASFSCPSPFIRLLCLCATCMGLVFKRYLMSSFVCFHIQTSWLVSDYFCQEFNGHHSHFFWFIFIEYIFPLLH